MGQMLIVMSWQDAERRDCSDNADILIVKIGVNWS